MPKFLNGVDILANLIVDSDAAVGATIVDVQGSQGQLFSVTNSLTGDLFSVSDISGVPILNVNSSGAVDIDGALTINGGDVKIVKQNDAPILTLLHDGTNTVANDLLFRMQFQSDFDGGHQNWGKIELDTNNSAVRTNMDFYVKSASGAEQLALRLEGQPSAVPNAIFAGDITASSHGHSFGSSIFKAPDVTAGIAQQIMCADGSNAATFRTTTSGRVFEIRSQNSGTIKIDSSSTTFTGTVTGTTLTGTSLDINGAADISGTTALGGVTTITNTSAGALTINGGTGVSTTGAFVLRQNGDAAGNGIAVTSSHATSHRLWKDASGNFNIGSSSNSNAFKQDTTGNVTIEGTIGSGAITSTSTIKAATTFIADAVDPGNPSAAADNLRVSGYGVMGNRGTVYLTNASTASTAVVQIGVGGIHAAAPKLTIAPTVSTFATNVTAGSNSLTAGSLDINGAADISGLLTLSKSTGSLIGTAASADAFGYNSTAGKGHYIRGTASTYIYGGGKFWDGSTLHTLLHTGSTDLDSRYYTETESNSLYARKYDFSPGNGSGNRRFIKLFTVGPSDCSVVGKLSSAGDYGDSDRATYEIQIATRSNISFDVYQLSSDAVSDDYNFYYRIVSSNYEIWCEMGDYNQTNTFTRFSQYGTVAYNFDSATQTEPTSPSLTEITKSNIYHEAHLPTLAELGAASSGVVNQTDFVSAASGGTFGGKIVIEGDDITTTANTTAEPVLRLIRDITDSNFPNRKSSAVDFMVSRQQAVANNFPYTRLDFRLSGGSNDSSTPSLDVMSLLHNGNVGIGTTSPDALLDISSSSTSTLRLSNSDTALVEGQITGLIEFEQSDSTSGGSGVSAAIKTRSSSRPDNGNYFGTCADLGFWVSGSSNGAVSEALVEALTIKAPGNVGIGTVAPSSKLEISQQLSAQSTIDYPLVISSRDDANSINQLGGEGIGIKFKLAGNVSSTPGNSMVGASIATIREEAGDGDSSAGLGFFVTQNDETLDEALRIDHDGNVGIGTTSPSTKLQLKGDATYISVKASDDSNGVQLGTDSSGDGLLQLYDQSGVNNIKLYGEASSPSYINAGNVGIGTTSPVAALQVGSIAATQMSQVVGKARIVGTNYIPSSTQMGTLDIASTTRNSSAPFNQGYGPSLTFSQNISGYVDGYEVVIGAIKSIVTSGSNTGQESAMTFLVNGGSSTGVVERMRIAEDGNVGIGIADPTSTLHLSKAGGAIVKIGTSQNTSEIEAREVGSSNSLVFSSNNSVDHLIIDGSGNSTFAGTVTANGTTLTGTQSSVSGNAGSVTNGVYTTGDQTIGGAKTFSSITKVSNTTAASSNTTGALQVAGGMSVQGDFYLGGDFTVTGDTIFTSTANTTFRDTVIRLNDGVLADGAGASANAADIGHIFNRGTSASVFLGWREARNNIPAEFVMFTTTSDGQSAVTGAIQAGTVQTLNANIRAHDSIKIGASASEAIAVLPMIDEDSFASNVDTKVPTQQSVKAYVDGLASNYATSAQGTLATNALPKAGGIMTGDIKLNDNVEVEFGTDADVKMKFDGSDLVTTVPAGSAFMIGTNGGTPHDNSGKADFVVDVNAAPQISLNSNQVQIGSTDMNWASKLYYSSGTFLASWDSDLTLFTQGSSGASAKNIILRPQAANGSTTTVATFNGDTGTTLTGQLTVSGEIEGASLDINGNADISGTLTVATIAATDYGLASADIPNNAANTSGSAGSVAWANITGRPYVVNASTTSASTTTTIASVVKATYTAAFFDFVIKNGTNVRAGIVYACHDGTNVEFAETSTVDLGDTSDVTLSCRYIR